MKQTLILLLAGLIFGAGIGALSYWIAGTNFHTNTSPAISESSDKTSSSESSNGSSNSETTLSDGSIIDVVTE